MSLRELTSLQSLSKNANIVQIKELIREDDSQLHFVFEYMPDGNLYQFMKRCIDTRSNLGNIGGFEMSPSQDTVQSIILQVLKGLAHIHALGFIHRGMFSNDITL